MLNVISVMGRLVADPQMRQTSTGKRVATFRIACDRGRRDANGQNQADFFQVIAWEQAADFACKYFQKGQLVAVDGRLQTRQYQDKNGSNRIAVEIVAAHLHFAEPKRQAGQLDEGGYAAPGSQNAAPAQGYSAGGYDDFAVIQDTGDLPF